MLTSNSDAEIRSWLFATIIMGLIALSVFLVQHFIIQVFDIAVEISVFYIPAILLVVYHFSRRRFPKSSH